MELFRTHGLEGKPLLDATAFHAARGVMGTVAVSEDRILYHAIQVYVEQARRWPRPVRWMFEHMGESGKRFFTYHDETPENHYRTAYRDTCVAVTALYTSPPDSWKDAVTDACTVNFLEWDEEDPRKTLAKLIALEVSQALDPAISQAARDLIAQGKPGPATDTLAATVATLEHGESTGFNVTPDSAPYPEPGTVWEHHSGRLYAVVFITNAGSTRKKFPPTVVYQDTKGKTWSRPVSDWSRSFVPTDKRFTQE